jgi:prepilin-type N-terminal cleavage/methylation domain-containing protein
LILIDYCCYVAITLLGGLKMPKIRKKKGFTLIELLIVVAIIAILAAIAIPQFAQYRIRGFNASALTDLRNCRTSQEALFSDWRRYGASEKNKLAAVNGAAAAPGIVVTGPTDPTTNPTILGTTEPGTNVARGLEIAVGANIDLRADDSAGWASYVIQTKNVAGDTMYGADSDSTGNFRTQAPTNVGKALGATPGLIATIVDGTVEIAFGAAPWGPM